MKLTIIILTIFCVQASAAGYAQQISISENNASLAKVFSTIEKQSKYSFFYKGNVVQNTKVSVQLSNATIEQALSVILKNQPLAYTILDNTIIIKSKAYVAAEAAMEAPSMRAIIKGKVIDKNGKTLPGVTVKLKGAANVAAVTDMNGNYIINLPDGKATLIFSFVGYVQQEIPVNGQSVIDVKMLDDETNLNEIVIIGYGEVAKKDLTGSVSTIKAEAFENVPIVSIDQMLQGKSPGLQVTSISGQPGDGTTIRIRGGNSLSASNEPLYVVDGIIAGDDFNPNLLNPADVETIDILKDASSTAIYGARGSNGVILITTKRGKNGRDKISINSYAGAQKLPKYIEMMNGKEWATLLNEQLIRQGAAPFYPDVNAVPNTDWQREITRTAAQQNVNLQISGGDPRSTYMLSANYVNQDGIILNSGYKRYQFRANFTRHVSDKFEVNTTLNIGNSLTHVNTASLGGIDYYQSALGVAPTMPVYQANGQFALKREYSPGNLNHPLAQATYIENPVTRNNLLGNVTLNWKPIQDLTFKTSFGSQLNFIKDNRYDSGQLPVAKNSNSGGIARVSTSQEVMYLIENTLNYNKTFATDHSFSALVGMTFQSSKTESETASGSKYPTDVMEYNNLNGTDQSTFSIGSDLTNYALVSYLSRVNYGYKGKYLLTLTGRIDGSSRFSTNNKYAFFPAAAVAWRAIEEPFIKNLNVFSNLKIRASYGKVGNQAIPSYGSLSTLGQARYIFGANVNTLGYIQGNYGNPNLRWETTGQYDLGIEGGVLNNRLNFELDLYTKRTNDLLNNQQIPVQTGYSSIRTNIGDIRNTGIELSISSVNIDNKKFKWTSSFNIAANRNKVVDLGGVSNIITQSITYAGNVSQLTLNEPVGTFWGAKFYGVRKDLKPVAGAVGYNPAPTLGEALYVDRNHDGKLSIDDYGVIGDSNPDFFGGFSNTLSYKRFTLDFYLSYSYGNQIMNIADAFYNTGDPFTNQYKTIVNHWSPQNPDSDIPIMSRAGYVPNSRWVYDGSYLRLKSLTFGYNIPGKVIRAPWLQNIQLYVSGSNLFVVTNYPYYDPESNAYGKSSTVRGFDATNYPQSRTYVAGIKVDF